MRTTALLFGKQLVCHLSLGTRRPAATSSVAANGLRRIVTSARAGEKYAGTVKWFSVSKGYGFISPTDGSPDVFVHQTQINSDGFRSLAEGESVEYEISLDPNGRHRAANVTGPDGAQPVGTPRRTSPGGDWRDGGRDYGDSRSARGGQY